MEQDNSKCSTDIIKRCINTTTASWITLFVAVIGLILAYSMVSYWIPVARVYFERFSAQLPTLTFQILTMPFGIIKVGLVLIGLGLILKEIIVKRIDVRILINLFVIAVCLMFQFAIAVAFILPLLSALRSVHFY